MAPPLRPRAGHTTLAAVSSPPGAAGGDEEQEAPPPHPAWVYEPYTPPAGAAGSDGQPRRRYFKTGDAWVVPKKIVIPEDKIELSFVRSSGAGGQNVNKVNTQAVLRFDVMGASWLPLEVRERISKNEQNRINKEGCMIINSQEYRTQAQNRKAALDKLREIIRLHYPRPKVRNMRKGRSEKGKAINVENKRKRSEVKKNRRRVDVRDY